MANDAHNSGIAERYALAIFELAVEENAVDAVGADFAALKAMVAESADLARFVHAPVFSREAQKKGMAALLAAAGAAPLTQRFIQLLSAKRRLFALVDVIKAFDALVAAKRGEVDALVTSARPLSDAETASLKAAIKAKVGRDPRLDTSVDPAILGGLVIKVGSKMIDSSLRSKLNAIRIAMRG